MFDKIKEKLSVETENLAMPEIHVDSQEENKTSGVGRKEALEKAAEEKSKGEIDYSGAIPEFHVSKSK